MVYFIIGQYGETESLIDGKLGWNVRWTFGADQKSEKTLNKVYFFNVDQKLKNSHNDW